MSSFTRAIRPALQGSRAVLAQRLPATRGVARPIAATALYVPVKGRKRQFRKLT